MDRSEKTIYPMPLKKGDQIRVLAISRSIGGLMKQGGITEDDIAYASQRLNRYGFKVSFGEHVWDCNEHLNADIPDRIEDFHQALYDPDVKLILALSGGVGAIQMVSDISYDLIRENPKSICGYSDITVILNAILSKSRVSSFYGPNFSSFMMKKGFEYTEEFFLNQVFHQYPCSAIPSVSWSEDHWISDQKKRNFKPNEGYWVINEGECSGRIIGGTYSFMNLLGSEYYPSFNDTIIFLEFPGIGKTSLMTLDSRIRSLTFQKDFNQVKGIVIGRFTSNAGITSNRLKDMLKKIPEISTIPVLANVDFGHTTPAMTIPIGAVCRLSAYKEKVSLEFLQT